MLTIGYLEVLAGLFNLLLDGFSLNALVSLILAVGAGWLGAKLIANR